MSTNRFNKSNKMEPTILDKRLKLFRLAKGLSLESLAAEMGGIVTKQALSKYETGKAFPSPVVLAKLAGVLGIKASQLYSEPEAELHCIAYRKASKLGKKEQEKIQSQVKTRLENCIYLQNLTHLDNKADLPIMSLEVKSLQDAEDAAIHMRQKWKLGLDPISSVTGILEDHFVHVLEIEAIADFDGLSCVAKGKSNKTIAAAVASRAGIQGERQRLNLTHELGHLVLKVDESVDEEKAAFRFGASFLAPASEIALEVGKKRTHIGIDELFLLKKRFGLSIQAILYRLRQLEIISENHYSEWCKYIIQLGWKHSEPDSIQPEKPMWFRKMVLRAFSENLLTHGAAEAFLGEKIDQKNELSGIEKRAFMLLPLEQRRKLLAEQAEKQLVHYEKDSNWRELDVDDNPSY